MVRYPLILIAIYLAATLLYIRTRESSDLDTLARSHRNSPAAPQDAEDDLVGTVMREPGSDEDRTPQPGPATTASRILGTDEEVPDDLDDWNATQWSIWHIRRNVNRMDEILERRTWDDQAYSELLGAQITAYYNSMDAILLSLGHEGHSTSNVALSSGPPPGHISFSVNERQHTIRADLFPEFVAFHQLQLEYQPRGNPDDPDYDIDATHASMVHQWPDAIHARAEEAVAYLEGTL